MENQNIEYKESWQDEYLEWICGYANAHGGILFIGKDNDGITKGIDKPHELLKKIPDKITHTMGIIADVNLHHDGQNDYIEIIVEKYPSLVSYRGRYHYRSGNQMPSIWNC